MNWFQSEQTDIKSTVSKDKELLWPFWKEIAVLCVSKTRAFFFCLWKEDPT